MTDFEMLTLYRDCLVKAASLGLKLDVKENQIHVIKDGVSIIAKMRITQIEMFLAGYEIAKSEV